MSFSLRDRLSVLAALLLSVAATPCASSAGGLCFQTTPWEACTDYPDLECREVTVPRFYEPTTVVQGNAEGTLTNLERRVVSGKPKKHVWLLQGGPCTTADTLSVIVAAQIAKVLKKDYIIQIPSARCSPHTEAIPDYAEYPANLTDYVNSQEIPIQAYTTKNTARDIIATVEAEKKKNPEAEHYVYALSYGVQLLNQILLQKPGLFQLVLQDGSSPPLGLSRSIFKTQGLGLEDIAFDIAHDCAQSKSCRSASLDSLIGFVNNLAQNISTPCFDAFLQAAELDGPKDEVFYTITNTAMFLYNNPIPLSIFGKKAVEIKTLFPKFIKWYQGDHHQLDIISFDNRVMLWALTNHFAQCTPTSQKAFARLLPGAFGPILQFTQEFYQTLAAPESGLFASNNLLVEYIIFGENANPPWTTRDQVAAQANTLLRIPTDILLARDEARKAFRKFRNPDADLGTKAAQGIRADVFMINGALDPNTPVHVAKSTFEDIEVAKGYTKKFATFAHAGHAVSLGNWSGCTDLLFQAFFNRDSGAEKRFLTCLKAENEKGMDWDLKELKEKAGVDVWEGLDKAQQGPYYP